MEKRAQTVAPDRSRPDERQTADPDRDAPLFPAGHDAGPLQADGDRPLIGDSDDRAVTDVLDRDVETGVAPDASDLEFRGRRYRLAMADGFVGIWDLRTGEQVGSFMEDAFTAAWARYLELEQASSLGGFLDRAGELLRRRWYVVVVVVLGALTVAYLRFEDPSLSPTLIGERAAAPIAVTPEREFMLVGPGVAGAMDALKPSLRPSRDTRSNRSKPDKADGSGQSSGTRDGSSTSSDGTASAGSSTGQGSTGSSGSTDSGGSGGGNPPAEEPPPDDPAEPPPSPPNEPPPDA